MYNLNFIDTKYKPKNELIAEYHVEPYRIDFRKACNHIAGESSIGTWTDIGTLSKEMFKRLKPTVFSIKKDKIKIAYPLDLFEKGNMSQILSSIAGNIFGMKSVKHLRLIDIDFPKELVRSFKGPGMGLEDIRNFTKIKDRPIAGTIYKPKIGLTDKEQAKLAYRIYKAGIDFSKDDENLCSMRFNSFRDRTVRILEVIDKIKDEEGRNVIYVPNVTAPYEEMMKRTEFVYEHGGKAIMMDILTTGFSAHEALSKDFRKMIIHGHRALHGALTRDKHEGISMLVIAKIARLLGVSSLHTGTVVGKMEGTKEEVSEINDFLKSKWFGLKRVMPAASGGLHPGLIPLVMKYLGNDLIINCGGGLWGHPDGYEAGVKAIRQSIDATMEGISLRDYSKNHYELRRALEKWGS